MLQIVQIFSVRPPLGGVTGRFALDTIPVHESPLVAHRAPIPEDEPIPGEEPEPDEDPVPHPDPVIREPDDASPPPMSVATTRARRIACNDLGA